jgi:hypothetical protein
MLNHVTSADEIYHCSVENCDKYFGPSSEKNHHLQTVHVEFRRLQCRAKDCPKLFQTARDRNDYFAPTHNET